MGLAFVSPVLHDVEQEPPSTGRGWRRWRRRIGAWIRRQNSEIRLRFVLTFPPGTVILSVSEESRYVPLMRQMMLNKNRREGCRLAVRAA